MLLWIAHELRCRSCGSDRSLATCNVCKKPVCPSCRCGSGDLSDGYECVENCAPNLFLKMHGSTKAALWLHPVSFWKGSVDSLGLATSVRYAVLTAIAWAFAIWMMVRFFLIIWSR